MSSMINRMLCTLWNMDESCVIRYTLLIILIPVLYFMLVMKILEIVKETCINSLFATFANLHVRKRATFADLHSYTHAYCSFVLLIEAITKCWFWLALSACVINLAFWNFPYDLQVKRYSELNIILLNVAPIPVCPKIMWHTGSLYLANKELNRKKK